MKSLSPLVGVIPIFMLLVPSVYAGGPRYDYDESFDDIPGVGDCYNDGYEAGYAQKDDGNRANECTDKGDRYNVGFGYGCDGGLTKEDCDNIKENDSDLGDHEQLADKNIESCYNDGYEDGQNNPFDQDRNHGCFGYQDKIPELIQAKQEHPFSFSLVDDNCASVECVKEKMQTRCEKDSPERPVFINCYLIPRCLDFSEMTQTTCASGGDSYTSQSLRLTWVVLEGCTTQECIMKCRLEPLPAPPECARGVLL